MSSNLSPPPVNRLLHPAMVLLRMRALECLAWVAILAIAVVLRLHQWHEVSAWYDEAAAWKTIQFSWSEMWQSIQQNVHPPVYYAILKLWADSFGDSPDSLRAFSVLCGVLTVGAVGLLVREAAAADTAPHGSRWSPLLAGALYAVNPMAIEQSQQARMYALGILFAALLGLGTLRVLKSPLRWSGWVLVILFGNLLPLTHYYGLFTALVAAIVVSAKMGMMWQETSVEVHNAAWARFVTALAITLPVWMFWGPVFWEQHSRVRADYWIPTFTWSEPLHFCAEWVSCPWIDGWGGFFIMQLFLVAIAGVVFIAKSPAPARWALAGFAITPPVLSTVYSSLVSRNLLQDRYWSFAHLFFIVGLVMAVEGLSQVWVRRGLAIGLIAWSLFWVVQTREHRDLMAEQWGLRGAGETLRIVRLPHESVLVASPFFHPCLQWSQGSPHRIFVPALGPVYSKDFPGEAILRKEEVLPLAATLEGDSRRLWVLADDNYSHSLESPATLPLPAEWHLMKTFKFFEGNRLPASLELREYVRRLPGDAAPPAPGRGGLRPNRVPPPTQANR